MAWGLAIGYLRVRGAQPFPSVVPMAWGLVIGTWGVEGEEDTRTGGRPKPSLALGVPCVRPGVGVRLCLTGVAPSGPVRGPSFRSHRLHMPFADIMPQASWPRLGVCYLCVHQTYLGVAPPQPLINR